MARAAEIMQRSWTGEIATGADFIPTATPPARTEFLIAADMIVLAAAQCWCQPALMYDSVDTTTRRFTLITPPFARQAVAYFTTWGANSGAFQADIETDTTTSGSLGTSYTLTADADTITTPSQSMGTAAYADIGGIQVLAIVTGGSTINRAPGSTIDRQVDLAEALVRQVEDIETNGAHGFGLSVTVRSKDMETVT
jgi:hypothetical protein